MFSFENKIIDVKINDEKSARFKCVGYKKNCPARRGMVGCRKENRKAAFN